MTFTVNTPVNTALYRTILIQPTFSAVKVGNGTAEAVDLGKRAKNACYTSQYPSSPLLIRRTDFVAEAVSSKALMRAMRGQS